jgi:Flp pilus assembly protein TadD
MAKDQIESAYELIKAERYGEALHLLHQAIAQEPTNWNAYYLAGQCCRFLDDIDGAIRNLSQATKLKADEPSIHLALGIAFQLSMQWADAIEAFRRAIEADADYVLGYNSLALTQKQCGDLDEALHNYDAGAKALARRIVKAMQNSRSSPILKYRATVGELWSEYATYAALYLVSSVNDIDRMARLPDEAALEEERTEKHAGCYWGDLTNERNETLRIFLPNYFNSFREELKHNPEYSNLMGNRGTVLDLLGRDAEARLHFDEATEFLPQTTIKPNTENYSEGTDRKSPAPYVQRGNEWSEFVGSKNWSELTIKEQNQFFVEQFTDESAAHCRLRSWMKLDQPH